MIAHYRSIRAKPGFAISEDYIAPPPPTEWDTPMVEEIEPPKDDAEAIRRIVALVRASPNLATDSIALLVRRAACFVWRYDTEHFIGTDRRWPIVHRRQIAMTISAGFGRSYPSIGRAFNRDHTTVIYAVERYGKLVEEASGLQTRWRSYVEHE